MIDWTPKDRALLAEYNERNKGRLVEYLRSKIPKITAKSFEEVALQAKLAQGGSDIIDILEEAVLQAREPAPTAEEHIDVAQGIV